MTLSTLSALGDVRDGLAVGTTNVSPEERTPTENSVSWSGHSGSIRQPGLGLKYIFIYNWIAAGRYVVVVLYRTDQYLELCEVEVNGFIDGRS